MDLYFWPVVFYLMWSVPYAIFFFCLFPKVLERNGYVTMYNDIIATNPAVKSIVHHPSLGGEKLGELKYMSMHFIAVSIAFLLGPILWYVFVFV